LFGRLLTGKPGLLLETPFAGTLRRAQSGTSTSATRQTHISPALLVAELRPTPVAQAKPLV
jgi:hypothetical protein